MWSVCWWHRMSLVACYDLLCFCRKMVIVLNASAKVVVLSGGSFKKKINTSSRFVYLDLHILSKRYVDTRLICLLQFLFVFSKHCWSGLLQTIVWILQSILTMIPAIIFMVKLLREEFRNWNHEQTFVVAVFANAVWKFSSSWFQYSNTASVVYKTDHCAC